MCLGFNVEAVRYFHADSPQMDAGSYFGAVENVLTRLENDGKLSEFAIYDSDLFTLEEMQQEQWFIEVQLKSSFTGGEPQRYRVRVLDVEEVRQLFYDLYVRFYKVNNQGRIFDYTDLDYIKLTNKVNVDVEVVKFTLDW